MRNNELMWFTLICLEISGITVRKKFQWANATAIRVRCDVWLRMGWSRDLQTRTRLVDSLFCITCLLENDAFSVLHYVIKVTLHYLMQHTFEIHSALELLRTALLGCSLWWQKWNYNCRINRCLNVARNIVWRPSSPLLVEIRRAQPKD